MEALHKLFTEVTQNVRPEQVQPFVEDYAAFQKTQGFQTLLTAGPDSEEMRKLLSEHTGPMAAAFALTLALRRVNPMCYFADFTATEKGSLLLSLDTLLDTHNNHLFLDAVYTRLSEGFTAQTVVLNRWPTTPREIKVSDFILSCPTTLVASGNNYVLHYLHNEFKSETDQVLKAALGKWAYKTLIVGQHHHTDTTDYNLLVRDQNVVTIPGALLQTTFVNVVEYLKTQVAAQVKAQGLEDINALNKQLYKPLQ